MPYKSKADQAKASKRHYGKNKEKMKLRASNYRKVAKARNIDFIDSYLASHPCIDCGEADKDVLDFDHTGKKSYGVSYMVHSCWGLEEIKKEINKCEVRCANCHRKITRQRERESGKIRVDRCNAL